MKRLLLPALLAATLAQEQKLKDNAKAKEKIAELQEFVRRFSANASKAKQATSRARQIEKIKRSFVVPSRLPTVHNFTLSPEQFRIKNG